MRFEVIKVKTFQGDEYFINGDEKYVYFEHRAPPPNRATLELYRHALRDDGIKMCMLHLASEIKDLAYESRCDKFSEEFYNQAEALCWRVPHES